MLTQSTPPLPAMFLAFPVGMSTEDIITILQVRFDIADALLNTLMDMRAQAPVFSVENDILNAKIHPLIGEHVMLFENLMWWYGQEV